MHKDPRFAEPFKFDPKIEMKPYFDERFEDATSKLTMVDGEEAQRRTF